MGLGLKSEGPGYETVGPGEYTRNRGSPGKIGGYGRSEFIRGAIYSKSKSNTSK